MKGLVGYIISLDEEIQREIGRDLLDIKVPYMAEEYKEWMVISTRKPRM